ncbi:MAG TPA: SRPBCC family protein [Mycobacterium sp.]|nr:SRPBCC family protein [Mycobacterium sp.]
MSVKDSREVVIEASPEEILGVIADIENTPAWSPQYKNAEILDTHDDGRPRRARMRITAAGLTDEQVIEYTWAADSVSWTLISAGQLKAQDAKYTLTPQGDKTKVRFDIEVDPSIPIPGFLLKRAMKGGTESATDGLRKQVLKVKKGG